jgi:thiamine-monophosphate kinase
VRLSSEEELEEYFSNPDHLRFVRAHYTPEIFLEPAVWLRKNGLANAMIDISDGLGSDVLHILTESGLSGEIFLDLLRPVPGSAEDNGFPEFALDGGEDYALLFTISKSHLEELDRIYPSSFPGYRVIGSAYEGEPKLILRSETGTKEYQEKGFDHFR